MKVWCVLREVVQSGLLLTSPDDWDDWNGHSVFICDAITEGYRQGLYSWMDGKAAKSFLAEAGMPCGLGVFDHVPVGVDRQAARYDWLRFASRVARELGI